MHKYHYYSCCGWYLGYGTLHGPFHFNNPCTANKRYGQITRCHHNNNLLEQSAIKVIKALHGIFMWMYMENLLLQISAILYFRTIHHFAYAESKPLDSSYNSVILTLYKSSLPIIWFWRIAIQL